MNKVILSVLGHDRPGIVAAVANILYEQNVNIENVSQTILRLQPSVPTVEPNFPPQKMLKSQ